MATIQALHFHPSLGLSSKHLQTILPVYLFPGEAPPSESWVVELGDNDRLCCELSLQPNGKETDQTVALVHGLGGSHASGYMIRLARKLYAEGYHVLRINLRGCGSGEGLSKLPYHAGTSGDLLKVLQQWKQKAPKSGITLIGFSLGGNVVLKLMGELGETASEWIKSCIAVCAPLDLGETAQILSERKHHFYQSYYVKKISEQAASWMSKRVYSIHEFDNHVTAPLWGFKNAQDYYDNCSCIQFLPNIRHKTHLLFAGDDPFINFKKLQDRPLPSSVNLWMTRYGGHMGFLGKSAKGHHFYWLDQLLLNWVAGNFI